MTFIRRYQVGYIFNEIIIHIEDYQTIPTFFPSFCEWGSQSYNVICIISFWLFTKTQTHTQTHTLTVMHTENFAQVEKQRFTSACAYRLSFSSFRCLVLSEIVSQVIESEFDPVLSIFMTLCHNDLNGKYQNYT